MSQGDPVPFKIRRLEPGEEWESAPPKRPARPPGVSPPDGKPAGKPPGAAEGEKHPAGSPAPAESGVSAGLFPDADGALAFLGAVCGSGLAREAALRHAPDGCWWVEAPVPPARAAGLIVAARGHAYAHGDRHWVAVSALGKPARETGDRPDRNAWPQRTLRDLVAASRPRAARYRPCSQLEVLLPAGLVSWLLRRALAAGLDTQVTPVECEPLGGGERAGGFLHVRLLAPPERAVPASLVLGLTALPYTLAADGSAGAGGGLCVDVRRRLSLPPAFLASIVPAGETWLLGPPDVGHWRLRTAGEAVGGESFLGAPTAPPAVGPGPLPPARLPAPIPVRLAPSRRSRGPADGVLLDDAELDWARRWLWHRPLGETAFLLPGAGVHLLTSPGGLMEAVPFGIPLFRSGPGALYVEQGCEFHPPLPDGARQERFGLDDGSAVVVLCEGVFRFRTEHLLPAWTLWVGTVPEAVEDLSSVARRLLSQISDGIRRAELARTPPPVPEVRPVNRRDRAQLLAEAQRAELEGNLLRAAELLERAGLFGPAGRLYERAAGR